MSSYKIPFISLSGNNYEVRLYPSAEGYDSASAIQLTGAAQPFTTEEDSGTDILIPVRSSTGYVRIVTDDYSLQSALMPTTADGMRVTLVRYDGAGIKAMWEGYVQPTTYTQEWAGGPWEIEIPIISRLGMVMQNYLSEQNTGFLTIREWLVRLCGNVYRQVLIPDNELMTQGTMSWGDETVATPTALQLAFSEETFKDPIPLPERQDPTNTTAGLWEPGTNADIAESLSTTMRWVLRESGDTLIVDDPGYSGNYNVYDVSALADANPQPTEQTATTTSNLDDCTIADSDGTAEIILPIGSLSISGDADAFDDTVFTPTDEAWMLVGGLPSRNGEPEGESWDIAWPGDRNNPAPFSMYSQKVINNPEFESFLYTASTITYTEASGNKVTVGPYIRLSIVLGHERSSMMYCNNVAYQVLGQDPSVDGSLKQANIAGGGEICAMKYIDNDGRHTYTSIILGRIDEVEADRHATDVAVRFRSTLAHLLPSAPSMVGHRYTLPQTSLQITGDLFYGDTYTDVKANQQLTGSANQIIFLMSVTVGDHSYQDIRFDWNFRDNNKMDIKIPLDESFSLDAPVEVVLYTPMSYWAGFNPKYRRIDNFRVSIVGDTKTEANGNPLYEMIDYTIDLHGRFGNRNLEDVALTTKFGPPYSTGMLFSSSEGDSAEQASQVARQVGTLPGTDGAKYLCRRTFDWLKAQGAATRRVLKVPLEASTPLSYYEPLRMTDNTATYFPAAKTTEWRDDKTTITLIEIR